MVLHAREVEAAQSNASQDAAVDQSVSASEDKRDICGFPAWLQASLSATKRGEEKRGQYERWQAKSGPTKNGECQTTETKSQNWWYAY